MIATGDNRCGCRSDICQCEADLGFDINPWHFISEQLLARAAQAGEFLQKRTMARPDSAYLPWWDQCETTGGGCCDLFRHRAHIQVRKRNNWRVAGQTLIQDFPAVGKKKKENKMRLLKRWKKICSPPYPQLHIEESLYLLLSGSIWCILIKKCMWNLCREANWSDVQQIHCFTLEVNITMLYFTH